MVVTRPRSNVTTMIAAAQLNDYLVVTRPRSNVTTITKTSASAIFTDVVTRPRSNVTTIYSLIGVNTAPCCNSS